MWHHTRNFGTDYRRRRLDGGSWKVSHINFERDNTGDRIKDLLQTWWMLFHWAIWCLAASRVCHCVLFQAIMARPDGMHDILVFFLFYQWQHWMDRTACVTFVVCGFFRWQTQPDHISWVTFFIFHFFGSRQSQPDQMAAWHFLYFLFLANDCHGQTIWRDIFLKFWPISNQGQIRRHACNFLFFPLFCRWRPRPDHMACRIFFVLGFFCRWQLQPDHISCMTFFVFNFVLPYGNHIQTRRRAWKFFIFPFFCRWWPWPDHMACMTFFVFP